MYLAGNASRVKEKYCRNYRYSTSRIPAFISLLLLAQSVTCVNGREQRNAGIFFHSFLYIGQSDFWSLCDAFQRWPIFKKKKETGCTFPFPQNVKLAVMNRQSFCGSTAIFSVISFAGKDTRNINPANAQKIKMAVEKEKLREHARSAHFFVLAIAAMRCIKMQSFGPIGQQVKEMDCSRLSLLFFLFTLTPIHSLNIHWGVWVKEMKR